MLQQASAFMNNSNFLLIDRRTQQQRQQKPLTFSLVAIARNSGRTTVVIYINIISIKSIHELNIVEQSNARFWMPKRQQKTKMSLTALISWSFELQSEQMSFESFRDWNLFRAGNSINFEFSSGVRGFGPLKSEWIVYWSGQGCSVWKGMKGSQKSSRILNMILLRYFEIQMCKSVKFPNDKTLILFEFEVQQNKNLKFSAKTLKSLRTSGNLYSNLSVIYVRFQCSPTIFVYFLQNKAFNAIHTVW